MPMLAWLKTMRLDSMSVKHLTRVWCWLLAPKW
jgi:hypothetical protein